MATSDRTISKPIVNVLTKAQYQGIASPSADEFYLITDDAAVSAGTGISVNSAGGETIVSLDSSYAITSSDITTGTDTTNKLVSAKTIADVLSNIGGSGVYLQKVNSTVNQSELLEAYNNDYNNAITTGWWGSSNTNADVARKVVTCSGFTLTQGAIIGISFGAGNTTDTPTLNVNNTGAKSINMTNGAPSATNPLKWSAPSVLYFMYDGSSFRYLTSTNMGAGRPNQGAGSWYGISTTAATTAAKVSTIANFVPCRGALVSINFTYANTVNGLLTLNVNGTGAKNIYYNGSVTSSSNPLTWTAGEQITFILNSLTSDGGVGYRFVSRSKSSSPATVTLTQLQTGTDTTGYLISPKVLADYIASLDATNVAY